MNSAHVKTILGEVHSHLTIDVEAATVIVEILQKARNDPIPGELKIHADREVAKSRGQDPTRAKREYLAAEILELAGNVARDFHRKYITVRDILIAIRNDQELDQYLGRHLKEFILSKIHIHGENLRSQAQELK